MPGIKSVKRRKTGVDVKRAVTLKAEEYNESANVSDKKKKFNMEFEDIFLVMLIALFAAYCVVETYSIWMKISG